MQEAIHQSDLWEHTITKIFKLDPIYKVDNNKLPTDLCTTFQIIKLLIEKGNLNLVHNKNSYQHFNYLSRKRKLDKLYNEM